MEVTQHKTINELCAVRMAQLKVTFQDISLVLDDAGLTVQIIGAPQVAGLVASEFLKDPKKNAQDQDVSADEAFEFFDVDGDGFIQKGDLEVFLELAGLTDVKRVAVAVDSIMKSVDLNADNKIDRLEWREGWKSVGPLAEFRSKVTDENARQNMIAKYGAQGPEHVPLYAFGAAISFYGLPQYPKNPEERPKADCVFFGSPYDATASYRGGCRFGPAAVRRASQMTSFGYAPWVDKDMTKYKIYDAGDAAATPFEIQVAMNQVFLYAKRLWNTSKRVIGIGGDHTLSWSLLRAARDINDGNPVALVHLDSHLDTGDEYHGSTMSHGTALRRAMTDGCIDIEHSMHIGIHGSMSNRALMDEDAANGWETMTLEQFVEMGPKAAAECVKEKIGDVPAIISFDIDVCNPGETPGIGFPEPGGMNVREVFTFIRGLQGINCLGGEVCEFTPDFDNNEVTAHAVAQGAYEIMCVALGNVEPEEEPEEC